MPGLRLPGTVLQGQVLLRGVPDAGLPASPPACLAAFSSSRQPAAARAQGLPVSWVRPALPWPAPLPCLQSVLPTPGARRPLPRLSSTRLGCRAAGRVGPMTVPTTGRHARMTLPMVPMSGAGPELFGRQWSPPVAASSQVSWPQAGCSSGLSAAPRVHLPPTTTSAGEMTDQGQPPPPFGPKLRHPARLSPVLGEPCGLSTFPRAYDYLLSLLTEDHLPRHPVNVIRSEGQGGP